MPAKPRAGVDIHILKGDGQQAGGHLLARRDDSIVFPRIEQLTLLQGRIAPADKLIGDARHGRHDDRDFVAGINLALDVVSGVADAIDVGDRGSAELHNKTGHSRRLRSFTGSAPPRGRCRTARKARIDTGAMPTLQPAPGAA